MALDKIFGSDPDQDAEAFILFIECKINFALGTEPDPGDFEHSIYLFTKKALFSSVLRAPTADWYGSIFQDAVTWNDVRTLLITIFSDRRIKFRHRMEVERFIGADGEETRKFLHRMKKSVDKGWPDDIVRVAAADQHGERAAESRQRRQRYIDCTLKGLRPRYLQRKSQEYLMEHPKATWNDFSTHLTNKGISYQVSTSFLNDEEHNKAQMASLGQELKNLRTDVKEQRVNALEGNQKPIDLNQKGRQNAARFCGYCRTNGHTISYFRKKIRDEEVKKLENEATAERKVGFTQEYNRKHGPSHGYWNWTCRSDNNGAMMSTTHPDTNKENSDQAIRVVTTSVEIDPLSEETTRITTMGDTMITKQDHHTSHRKTNPGNVEVTRTIRDRLQRRDKVHPSRIYAGNPDQLHLIIQCLTVLETKIQTRIYLTTRGSRPPITVISQTSIDSLRQTIQLIIYLDYAPRTNRSQPAYPDSQSVLRNLT